MTSLPPPFSVTIHPVDDNSSSAVRVTVGGEFVVGNASLFDDATGHLVRGDMAMIVVALDEVTLLDSAGIGAILRLRQRCIRNDVDFGVDAPVPFQREIFMITGLQHLLVDD